MSRVIITGLPRSGTKYIATVLSAAGIECSHEKVFHVSHPLGQFESDHFAEASWIAAPVARSTGCKVVLLKRDRIAVLQSIMRDGFLNSPNEYSEYIETVIGRLPREPFFAATEFMQRWESLVQPDLTLRVEDITAESLILIAGMRGLITTSENRHNAILETPKDINHR